MVRTKRNSLLLSNQETVIYKCVGLLMCCCCLHIWTISHQDMLQKYCHKSLRIELPIFCTNLLDNCTTKSFNDLVLKYEAVITPRPREVEYRQNMKKKNYMKSCKSIDTLFQVLLCFGVLHISKRNL